MKLFEILDIIFRVVAIPLCWIFIADQVKEMRKDVRAWIKAYGKKGYSTEEKIQQRHRSYNSYRNAA